MVLHCTIGQLLAPTSVESNAHLIASPVPPIDHLSSAFKGIRICIYFLLLLYVCRKMLQNGVQLGC